MTYPPDYTRRYNFVTDEARGLTSPAPAKVDAELDALQGSFHRLRSVVVGVTTATGALKPNQAVNASITEVQDPDEFTASGGTPESFTFTTAIDTDTNSVHVYKNGLLQISTDLTLTDTTVALNTTPGDAVVVHFFDDEGGITTTLAATGGAALVGYDDSISYDLPINATATTVQATLDLLRQNLANVNESLYPTTQWLAADGSQELSDDWDVGGTYRIVHHPASTQTGEVVVHQQLSALTEAFAGLGTVFVSLNGDGVMTDALDMGSNRVVNAASATAATGLTTKGQMDTAIAVVSSTVTDLEAKIVPLAGADDADIADQAEFTGSVSFGAVATDSASSSQGAGAAVPTLHGVPLPTAGSHVANKQYVDNLLAGDEVATGTIFDHFAGVSGAFGSYTTGDVDEVCSVGHTDAWGSVLFEGGSSALYGRHSSRLPFDCFDWSVSFRFRIWDYGNDDIRWMLGVCQPASLDDYRPAGLYFYARSNVNQWQIAYRQSGGPTLALTTVTISNLTWHVFRITKSTTDSKYHFYIDDVKVATRSFNTLVGAGLDLHGYRAGAYCGIDGIAGSDRVAELDWAKVVPIGAS